MEISPLWLDPKIFEGKEDSTFEMQFGGGQNGPRLKCTFIASEYMNVYGYPNFWFHLTTAYDILRAQGVPVGKMDFLNGAGKQGGMEVVEEQKE